jgi:hypothetical protein
MMLSVDTENLLDFVLSELDARKGQWASISRALAPDAAAAHYSWLTKLGQRKIPDPGVNKIQELADYFWANPVEREEESNTRIPRESIGQKGDAVKKFGASSK